jgi:hypothetical protein
VARIKGALAAAIKSRELEREVEKGGVTTGRVGERSSHLVGLDQVGWRRQVG